MPLAHRDQCDVSIHVAKSPHPLTAQEMHMPGTTPASAPTLAVVEALQQCSGRLWGGGRPYGFKGWPLWERERGIYSPKVGNYWYKHMQHTQTAACLAIVAGASYHHITVPCATGSGTRLLWPRLPTWQRHSVHPETMISRTVGRALRRCLRNLARSIRHGRLPPPTPRVHAKRPSQRRVVCKARFHPPWPCLIRCPKS